LLLQTTTTFRDVNW